mgnify:CR=1 FL=1
MSSIPVTQDGFLQAVNKIHLNGKQLQEGEIKTLEDGDLIQLGLRPALDSVSGSPIDSEFFVYQ